MADNSNIDRTNNIVNKPKKLTVNKILSFVLIMAGVCMISYYCFVNILPKIVREIEYSRSGDVVTLDSLDLKPISELEDSYAYYQYPTDKLFKSVQRQNYQDGDLYLYVPRLNYEGKVLDGTSNSVLKRGIGLYNYSPLPSFGNPNVSIAGHRGVSGAEFYKLDEMREGDLVYLYYDGYEFIYTFASMNVVNLNNWSSIYCSDQSSVTLTTCAMDNNVERIIVTAHLVSVRECLNTEKYYLNPDFRDFKK